MSSRLTRTLLKLYPRRIRDRYGDELLDLQDELRTRGDVSRLGLIRDMLAGSLLARPARRTHLIFGAILVIGGLALAVSAISGPEARPAAPAAHARLKVKSINAVPYGSCFVGSSCSLTPCNEFTDHASAEDAVAYRSLPGTSRLRPPATRCGAYPHVRAHEPVFVGE